MSTLMLPRDMRLVPNIIYLNPEKDISIDRFEKVSFGPYEWLVLDEKADCKLLISRDVIETREYQESLSYEKGDYYKECLDELDEPDPKYLQVTDLAKRQRDNQYWREYVIERMSIVSRRKVDELDPRRISSLGDINIEKRIEDYCATWETSDLRSYLNKYFLRVFSEDDQKRIVETIIETPDNPKYGTKGGPQTKDKVFLLSIDEAEYYFRSNEERRCVFSKDIERDFYEKECNYQAILPWWWLRSPGAFPDITAYVDYDGTVCIIGNYANEFVGGIRPALWVKF